MAMLMNRLRVAAAMAERSFYAQNRIATPIDSELCDLMDNRASGM